MKTKLFTLVIALSAAILSPISFAGKAELKRTLESIEFPKIPQKAIDNTLNDYENMKIQNPNLSEKEIDSGLCKNLVSFHSITMKMKDYSHDEIKKSHKKCNDLKN